MTRTFSSNNQEPRLRDKLAQYKCAVFIRKWAWQFVWLSGFVRKERTVFMSAHGLTEPHRNSFVSDQKLAGAGVQLPSWEGRGKWGGKLAVYGLSAPCNRFRIIGFRRHNVVAVDKNWACHWIIVRCQLEKVPALFLPNFATGIMRSIRVLPNE